MALDQGGSVRASLFCLLLAAAPVVAQQPATSDPPPLAREAGELRRDLAEARSAKAGQQPDPWFSTFSIIAFDPATNELGVAVQSRAFAAGAAVPFAKPGVGAVATQASANRTYGPKAIALLEQGLSPAEVVKRITDEDPGRDTRQARVS